MGSNHQFEKFFRLEKMDFQGIAIGVAAAEEVDHDGEVLDYFASKPYFQKWSDTQKVASGGKSLGNVRLQHDPTRPVGRLLDLAFDDKNRMVRVVAKIEEDQARRLLQAGVLTGFSIGGDYVKKTPTGNGIVRYVAGPSEISVCDRPCAPSAVFSVVKDNGQVELRKFQKSILEAPMNQLNEREQVLKLRIMGMNRDQICTALGSLPGHVDRVLKTISAGMMKSHGLVKGELGIRAIIQNTLASRDQGRIMNLCTALGTDEDGLRKMLGAHGIA